MSLDRALPMPKLRPPEAARFLGVSVEHLRDLRRAKTGPALIRYGRFITYDIRDLEAWAAAHRREPLRPVAARGLVEHLA